MASEARRQTSEVEAAGLDEQQREKLRRTLIKARQLAEAGHLEQAEHIAYQVIQSSGLAGENAAEKVLEYIRIQRARAALPSERYTRVTARSSTQPTRPAFEPPPQRTPGRIWLYLAVLLSFGLLASLIPAFASAAQWAGSMTQFGAVPLTATDYPAVPLAFALALLGVGLLYALRGGPSTTDRVLRYAVWGVVGLVLVLGIVGLVAGLLVITT